MRKTARTKPHEDVPPGIDWLRYVEITQRGSIQESVLTEECQESHHVSKPLPLNRKLVVKQKPPFRFQVGCCALWLIPDL